MSFRVIDAGMVDWLDSQVIYHAVASAMREASEDTLTLVHPDIPYACIGYHQELEKEVDLEYCAAHGLPITRRQVGGGAVYLDKNQLFWHIIVHRSRAPYRIEDIYSRFLAGPVNALRAMGIPAEHRPVNDIQVAGRKIGGTGAATIGEAIVVVGSLIFDFDYELMAHVLKVPSEKFRDKVYQSLREYLTTIRRELGADAPTWEEGKRILIDQIGESLGQPMHFGELSARERREMAEWRKTLMSKEWLYQTGGLHHHGVKIAESVHVREAAYKARGGLLRATIRVREHTLDDVTLSGDFFIYPQESIGPLEQALIGAPLHEKEVRERITAFWQEQQIQSPGMTPDDVASVVMLAAHE
ncbi:MAG TPA: lipoate protein ligase C-terminal domain-containing protein [Ktedonobacteraceae bacterium]|nr:lipoate protein ligase C-terminal domain-containing protein [Ktedonobacteraceae bacterium]